MFLLAYWRVKMKLKKKMSTLVSSFTCHLIHHRFSYTPISSWNLLWILKMNFQHGGPAIWVGWWVGLNLLLTNGVKMVCAVWCCLLPLCPSSMAIFLNWLTCRWALGVLIYFLLQGEMPFGSWRESELDTFAKIAKGQFILSHNLSPEAVDLITKVFLSPFRLL